MAPNERLRFEREQLLREMDDLPFAPPAGIMDALDGRRLPDEAEEEDDDRPPKGRGPRNITPPGRKTEPEDEADVPTPESETALKVALASPESRWELAKLARKILRRKGVQFTLRRSEDEEDES